MCTANRSGVRIVLAAALVLAATYALGCGGAVGEGETAAESELADGERETSWWATTCRDDLRVRRDGARWVVYWNGLANDRCELYRNGVRRIVACQGRIWLHDVPVGQTTIELKGYKRRGHDYALRSVCRKLIARIY